MIRYILLLLLLSPIVEAKEPILIPEQPLEEYPQFLGFLNDHYDERYILINRSSQQLIVIDNMEVILSQRVIVGKKNWETPLAETFVEYVITNPYWNVPKSISIKETIPKIKKNYKKYQQLGYRVYYQDKVYDAIYALYLPPNEIKIKQLPGKWNALGKIKFKFSANMRSIYAHDTSIKSKFKKSDRRLSHGCVRLEKPIELLESISDIKYKHSLKEKWFKLKEPVPVYIVDWEKIKIINNNNKK